jgi:hypothetical protein
LYHQGGTVDIVADVVGYYSPVSGDYFTSVTPVRALDTRDATGAPATRVSQGGVVSLQVAGANGVPANATGVVINVTAVTPDVAGYVTAYPNGVTRPVAANLNFVPGDIVPNLVIVGIGAQGKVNFYNQNGTLDLVGDIVGYYSPDNTGKQFFPVTPVRALDTRDGTGGFSAAVGQGASIDLGIRGANGIPNTASAIVMNTTHHWREFASALLSREFLTEVKAHLTPDGIAFWNCTESPRAARTGMEVFPHTLMIMNHCLASNAPLEPNRDRWQKILADYRIDGQPVIAADQIGATLDFLTQEALPESGHMSRWCRREAMQAAWGDAEIITDDNLGHEYP